MDSIQVWIRRAKRQDKTPLLEESVHAIAMVVDRGGSTARARGAVARGTAHKLYGQEPGQPHESMISRLRA